MRVCNIFIYVSDLDFAIEWYTEVLGLEISSEHYHHPTAVDIKQENDIRLILHQTERDTDIDIWQESSTIAMFEVESLRAKIKELKERGVTMLNDEPKWFPDGERIAFKDPFGNIHELAEMKEEDKKKS